MKLIKKFFVFLLVISLTLLDIFLTKLSLDRGNIEMNPIVARMGFSDLFFYEICITTSIFLLLMLGIDSEKKFIRLSSYVALAFLIAIRIFAAAWNGMVIFLY